MLRYVYVVCLVTRSSDPLSCVPTGVKSSLFATISSQALPIRPTRPLRDETQLYFILSSFPKINILIKGHYFGLFVT